MNTYRSFFFLFLLATVFTTPFFCLAQSKPSDDPGIPQIVQSGKVSQLYVNNKPFLILGGELNNSSSSNREYMQPIWQLATDLHFNTLLTPLSWDLIEPEEGKFDFALVDDLIKDARQHKLHLVFLWLASWKNGMSSYMPLWVKESYQKYPRIKTKDGKTEEVLTPLSDASAKKDATAVAALMKHIKQFDGTNHTVLMMQIENEVGILGDSRDRSELANKAFAAPVDKELMNYLVKNKEVLVPEIKERWTANGSKTSGSWESVFGKSEATDELFMAWYYARYVNTVALAGKKEYPIPMYTNAWLNQGDNPKPGDYPSGGPLAHVLNIWKAGAPALDMLSPDIYVAEYEERCKKFTQAGNILFIPEMNSGEDGVRNIFIAIGKYNAIGVSPFGIDHLQKDAALGKSYDLISQVSPLILKKQAKSEIVGFVIDEKNPFFKYDMGGYTLEISLDEVFGHRAKIGYGLVMTDDGPNKFMGAGSGFRVRFFPKENTDKTRIGIGSVDEGVMQDGIWIKGRRLNGDENDQGRAWRFSSRSVGVEKCTVYSYK